MKKKSHKPFFKKERNASPILRVGKIIFVRVKDVFSEFDTGTFEAYGEASGHRVSLKQVPDNVQAGDTVAAKLIGKRKDHWWAEFIRIVKDQAPLMGVYDASTQCVYPLHYKRGFVPLRSSHPLRDQEVILFEEKDGKASIKESLGLFSDPKAFSKMAAYTYGVWHPITDDENEACQSFEVPAMGNRIDFRNVPLVTIDGKDARDFDDAVWAEADTDPLNQGGFRIVVAIADVAYYVRTGSLLDSAARERGNSVYFPDIVLPMLPEKLSNDLCSLRPHVDRACVIADMVISAKGLLKAAYFKRAIMRSHARLTYEEVEKAIQGKVNKTVDPVMASTIVPLYQAYQVLKKSREERGSLNIKSQEHEIEFDRAQEIKEVRVRKELTAHKIIEEMMVLANVAVARALKNRNLPSLYRVHSPPDAAKVEILKNFTKILSLPKIKAAIPTPHEFNRLLEDVRGTPYDSLINDLVLRSQSQARYSSHNEGHFGLGLQDYSHFTSPIRRYSDLITHRILIEKFQLGEGGYLYEELEDVAEHISGTERKSAAAEREAKTRYIASFLSKHIGEEFQGCIVGVNQAGLFIQLEDLFAEAFLPKRLLLEAFPQARSSFFDASYHMLRIGKETFHLGMEVKVVLTESDPVKNQIVCDLVRDSSQKKEKEDKGKSFRGKHKERKEFSKKEGKIEKRSEGKKSKPPRKKPSHSSFH